MAIKQLSVFAENKKGSVLSPLNELASAGVDLRALSIAETAEFGILRFIVADTEKASAILKENGYVVAVTEVIGVQMPDVPGGLVGILDLLASAGVNIEYLYAFITPVKDHAYVVLRVADNQAAENLLKVNGMTLITDEVIKSL